MADAERFPYTVMDSTLAEASLLPLLPIKLTNQGRWLEAKGLLDTGSTVNVLPYEIGLQLGAVWNEQRVSVRLTGNLARFEAHPLVLEAAIGKFSPVRLVFAWTQAQNVPLILGQVNFFLEFDVCFYRSQQFFEVKTN